MVECTLLLPLDCAERVLKPLDRLLAVSSQSELVDLSAVFSRETVVSSLAAKLLGSVPAMTDRLVALIRRADERYLDVSHEQLYRSCQENLFCTLSDLAAQRPVRSDAARETARNRAEQGVPVGSVLHAFRLGFTVIWDAMLEEASGGSQEEWQGLARAANEVWTAIDAHSGAVTEAYQDRLSELARRDERQRTLLLDALFEGRRAEWNVLNGSLRALDLPDRGPYVAVSAETPEAGKEGLSRVEHVLQQHGVHSAWRLRADEQVGIVAVSRQSPRHVTEVLRTLAMGRVGMSRPYEDAMETPRALSEAEMARRSLPAGQPGVETIDADPLSVLAAASPDVTAWAARVLLGDMVGLPAEEGEMLLHTLNTWFTTGGNVNESGELLFCHRNTVRNRLRRIEELTGRSLADPRGIAELYLAAKAISLFGTDALK